MLSVEQYKAKLIKQRIEVRDLDIGKHYNIIIDGKIYQGSFLHRNMRDMLYNELSELLTDEAIAEYQKLLRGFKIGLLLEERINKINKLV